jgi:hypothetical protein
MKMMGWWGGSLRNPTIGSVAKIAERKIGISHVRLAPRSTRAADRISILHRCLLLQQRIGSNPRDFLKLGASPQLPCELRTHFACCSEDAETSSKNFRPVTSS